MKNLSKDLVRELIECGVEHLTIRTDKPFDVAAHLVELGARWWSPVCECEQADGNTADGSNTLRRWMQGSGDFVIDGRRLAVLVATEHVVVAQAA